MTKRPKLPRKPETGRKCAVCGKTTSPTGRKDTYGFHGILAHNNIKGDKAHPDCVQRLRPAVACAGGTFGYGRLDWSD